MRPFLLLFMLAISMYASSINNLSGDFIQTLTSPESDTITYKGYVYIDSDKKALWVYESPNQKKIFFQNNTVTVIEPLLEQAIITKLDSTYKINNILNETLKEGKKSIEHQGVSYDITFQENKPTSISYIDEMENRVTISLKNVLINEKIDSALFTPKIPSHYDVIKH